MLIAGKPRTTILYLLLFSAVNTNKLANHTRHCLTDRMTVNQRLRSLGLLPPTFYPFFVSRAQNCFGPRHILINPLYMTIPLHFRKYNRLDRLSPNPTFNPQNQQIVAFPTNF